jgi:phospholipid/cholesterol/gamma-HCH transport system substrate-binding protein
METRANYVLVGAFVTGLTLLLVAAIIFLANLQFDTERDRYDILFTGSVTGIDIGSQVRYRGVSVGTVQTIGIDQQNVERIRVTVDILAGTPIKEDSIASIELLSLAGVAYVQISGGTQQSALLQRREGERYPIIPSRPSVIDQLFSNVPQLLSSAEKVTTEAAGLLTPENVQSITNTVRNLETLTDNLAKAGPDIALTVKALNTTLASVEQLARNLEQRSATLTQTLDTQITQVGGELSQTLAEVRSATREASGLLAENREPLRESVAELEPLIRGLTRLSENLARLAQEIERDPRALLYGTGNRGVETP